MHRLVRSVNWLAVFSATIGLYVVVFNYELAFTQPWSIGLFVGAFAAISWVLNKNLGLWLVGAAGVLAGALLFEHAITNPLISACSSGASLGVMLVLASDAAWRRWPRSRH